MTHFVCYLTLIEIENYKISSNENCNGLAFVLIFCIVKDLFESIAVSAFLYLQKWPESMSIRLKLAGLHNINTADNFSLESIKSIIQVLVVKAVSKTPLSSKYN